MTASNGTSLQQQDIALIQERALPSSPSPLYSSHSKTSSFMKSGLGQPSTWKQLIAGQGTVDNSRGLLQWVQIISFISVSIDHSLQLMFQMDSTWFVVSKAVLTVRRDARSISKDELPSVLYVSLLDYYDGSKISEGKFLKGVGKGWGKGYRLEDKGLLNRDSLDSRQSSMLYHG